MPYRVVSFTMAQVRQGALGFQRQLSAVLREHPEVKVYSVSPFDLDERRRFKDRFGGDIVYFLNDAAFQACERLGLGLQFVGEISEDELPRRRTLVIGIPERTGNASAK
jgi:peroxiredoxin